MILGGEAEYLAKLTLIFLAGQETQGSQAARVGLIEWLEWRIWRIALTAPKSYPDPSPLPYHCSVSGFPPQWAPPLDSGLGHVTCFNQWDVGKQSLQMDLPSEACSLSPCIGHTWAR